MYRVLIIDDEEIVREGICELIPWQDEGFAICGQGVDGVDGLEKILQYRPELVIIDVKMPGRTGLEVIREARNAGFAGEFIILTGYAEFEFARTAMTLGVREYVLKPIDEDELTNAVRKIYYELKQIQSQAQHHHANEEQAKQELIRRILMNLADRSSLEKEAARLHLDLEGDSYCAAVCMDRRRHPVDENSYIQRVIHLLHQEESGDWKIVLDGCMILVARGERSTSWQEYLQAQMKLIQEFCGQELLISVGVRVRNWYDVCYSYEFARYLLDHKFLFADKQVLTPALLDAGVNDRMPEADELEALLEVGDAAGIGRAVQRFCNCCEWQLLSETTVKLKVDRMLTALKHSLSEKYGAGQLRWDTLGKKIQAIQSAQEVGVLAAELEAMLREASDRICYSSAETIVKRVYYYMQKNYSKDLKLETLAALFGYNSAYLGKMFRREIGESFNNALDAIRIASAKRLLVDTDQKVYKICEQVGYNNLDYFYMKFRKYVGISPKEYRQQYRKEDRAWDEAD